MVDNIIRQTSKKTWYTWSMYINIFLFLLVAVFVFLVVRDAYEAGYAACQVDILGYESGSSSDLTGKMFALSRDVAILGVIIALIFFQFFRNLMTIMKRSL